MRRSILVLATIGLLTGIMAAPALAHGNENPNAGAEVYVTSQGLVYETIVLGELPFVGNARFQELEMDGPTGLQTEFGPGDPGYLGGRWWVDVNGNDVMDEGDSFFLCPLIGPGHSLS